MNIIDAICILVPILTVGAILLQVISNFKHNTNYGYNGMIYYIDGPQRKLHPAAKILAVTCVVAILIQLTTH